MEYSQSMDTSIPGHWDSGTNPHDRGQEDVRKIDQKNVFKSYAKFSVPKNNERTSKTPAQDRLLRLQNALRGEVQKTQQPEVRAPTTLVRLPVKRKAQDDAKVVPEKKRSCVETALDISKRPKLTTRKRSANDNMKRTMKPPPNGVLTYSQRSAHPEKPATVTSASTATVINDITMASPPKKLKISPSTTATKVVTPEVPQKHNGKDYRISVTSKDNRLIIDYEDLVKPLGSPHESNDKDLTKTFYMVIDTNVFCHNLIFLENFINMKFAYGYAIMYIPYVVIEELDKIKHKPNHKEVNSCVKAIQYINEKLQARHPQVKGQSARNYNIIDTPTPDDSIVNCCLQLKSITKKVILLSNDINLRNKAICNGINAFRPKDIKEDVVIEFF